MATTKKRKRGRPPSAVTADDRYTVNYTPEDNALIERAAAKENERFAGRWIGRAALAQARLVLDEEPSA